jgi:hypothetical protein
VGLDQLARFEDGAPERQRLAHALFKTDAMIF